MNRRRLILSLALIILAHSACLASSPKSTRNLAVVSLIQLGHAETRFRPLSESGFVVVAVEGCSFLVNGKKKSLQAGQHQVLPGRQSLTLSESTDAPTLIVIVNVVSISQNLTFGQTTLAAHEVLEDASDRNATLIVATAHSVLVDVVDQAAEGEPWKSGRHRQINLRKGGHAWLAPGTHRLRNAGSSSANFISIEW